MWPEFSGVLVCPEIINETPESLSGQRSFKSSNHDSKDPGVHVGEALIFLFLTAEQTAFPKSLAALSLWESCLTDWGWWSGELQHEKLQRMQKGTDIYSSWKDDIMEKEKLFSVDNDFQYQVLI